MKSVRTQSTAKSLSGTVIRTAVRNGLMAAVFVGCWLLAVAWAEGPQSGLGTAVETSSLRDLEHRVQEAAKKVLPTVVSIGNASGVIVTADGLILSQAHVSHGADPQNCRKPGERTKVTLQDDRTCEAELLGADLSYDLSLLRLLEPGPYPHAPLDENAKVKAGDMVLKLGHPWGYRHGRPPVVRAGRVLSSQVDWFFSDCYLNGGDSGGPFFDLDGRLVGIVWSTTIMNPVLEALSVSGGAERFAGVFPFTGRTNSLIAGRIAAMRRGELVGPDQKVQREESEILQWVRPTPMIPAERWTQGTTSRAAYRDAVQQARLSVVAIQDGDEVVALGTVVGVDGWVVAKASELPAEPRCRMPEGQVLATRVVGIDPAFDVALLKVSATDLTPIAWADEPLHAAGTCLAAVGPEELPLAVGVVSVPRRDLPGPFPDRVEPPRREPAALPELIGSAVQGRGYWVEFVDGRAAEAGIQPGDVILTIAGKAVRCHQDLAGCVEGRWANDRVAVCLLRAGKPLNLSMRLRAEGASWSNLRSEGFPTVLEFDAPLLVCECGGPVVDLSGKAVGITIARGPYGCMAIPGDCIQRLLPDLKSGKLASHWTAYREALLAQTLPKAPTTPAEGQAVTLTLDELTRKLLERRERTKSLMVEYDVVSEAYIEPQLLAVWYPWVPRDREERHRIAFAGAKQFAEVQSPGVMVQNAPVDRLVSDPNAPAALAEDILRRQRAALGMKQQGMLGHLYSRQGQRTRSIFDGAKSFFWYDVNRPVPPSNYYYSPTKYLAGLGLRPLDPQPSHPETATPQQFWFPDNFALYEKCRVLPHEETVDGAPCIVVEAERYEQSKGKRQLISDRLWFDAKLGFAPRKWEQRVDVTLGDLWTHADFEEVAPGCWLPWRSTCTHGTPPWVSPELRNRPAYGYNMRLRKVKVNCVLDDLFKP